MTALPESVLEGLSPEQQADTQAWWAGLTESVRQAFVQLWDARAEDAALYGAIQDDEIVWHPIPLELQGRLTDEADALDHDLAKQHLLEYVSNHEDIQFFLVENQFHICRQHPAARALIRAGLIPAGFRCPAGASGHACPMEAILMASGGRSVRLEVTCRR